MPFVSRRCKNKICVRRNETEYCFNDASGVDTLILSTVKVVLVRVKFNGNLFHPAEGLFKRIFADLLHSYCLGRDRYFQAFAGPEIFYYSAITVASFALNCFRNALFKCIKLNRFRNSLQLCRKPELLVFYAQSPIVN